MEDSFARVMTYPPAALKMRLNVVFDGEAGLDYGGVSRGTIQGAGEGGARVRAGGQGGGGRLWGEVATGRLKANPVRLLN